MNRDEAIKLAEDAGCHCAACRLAASKVAGALKLDPPPSEQRLYNVPMISFLKVRDKSWALIDENELIQAVKSAGYDVTPKKGPEPVPDVPPLTITIFRGRDETGPVTVKIAELDNLLQTAGFRVAPALKPIFSGPMGRYEDIPISPAEMDAPRQAAMNAAASARFDQLDVREFKDVIAGVPITLSDPFERQRHEDDDTFHREVLGSVYANRIVYALEKAGWKVVSNIVPDPHTMTAAVEAEQLLCKCMTTVGSDEHRWRGWLYADGAAQVIEFIREKGFRIVRA